LGVDGLRLWVAMYGCENATDIKLGLSTIKDLELRIFQLRGLLRFILGSLKGYQGERPTSLPLLDQVCDVSFLEINFYF
jgi:isoleucyl-tRNA synthetase